MPSYHRAYIPGGTYFFTVVTNQRYPVFADPTAPVILRASLRIVKSKRPFDIIAICVLPDHLHCIWKLPEYDFDYSTRWRLIKTLFSRQYLKQGGRGATITESKFKKRELGVWQRRFWEHVIRDEKDLYQHIDYIHYNPVKHGLVNEVNKWPWSSFHRFVRMGFYSQDWGADLEVCALDTMHVGE